MKIVSLLPSATEIAYALGLGDQLEAVTFECDHPPEARAKPVVSTTALPEGLDVAAIDRAVVERMEANESIYRLDRERLRTIDPDVILTQDLCHVCAVPTGEVADALDVLGCSAAVVSLDPSTLDEVIACVGQVGAATGTEAAAARLMASLRDRVEAVRAAVADRPRRRVLALEWSDPPYSAAHWVPEMLAAAGADPVLAEPGARSHPVAWPDIAAARPEGLVALPCGFGLADAVAQGRSLLERPELAGVAWAAAVDATGHWSRPGPRVVDGIEALAAALHPGTVPEPPPGSIQVLRATDPAGSPAGS